MPAFRLTLIVPLLLAASPASEDIDRAFKGLVAEVEDDLGPDRPLKALRTKGCKTKLIGKGGSWTVDWTKAQDVGLGDTFIFISAPPIKLAIVGDASKPDQWAKLQALHRAMTAKVEACRPHRSWRD